MFCSLKRNKARNKTRMKKVNMFCSLKRNKARNKTRMKKVNMLPKTV